MARNEEKAMNLFNKWQTFKRDFHSKDSNRRPLLASDCDSVIDAEKYRREIIREISKKIPLMQNATLGEYKLREMNDEINKLMGKKHYWEIRIRELGGSVNKGRQIYDIEGKELPGQPGYRYYGAAKDLPGVRELFAEAEEEIEARKHRKSRKDLSKHITPDYYGYRDDDDGVLAAQELPVEKRKRQEAETEFVKAKKARDIALNSSATFGRKLKDPSAHSLALGLDDQQSDEEENAKGEAAIANWLIAQSGLDPTAQSGGPTKPVGGVPTQEEMQAILLAEKKKMLLGKFGV